MQRIQEPDGRIRFEYTGDETRDLARMTMMMIEVVMIARPQLEFFEASRHLENWLNENATDEAIRQSVIDEFPDA